jgi:hypothetical protein
MGRREDMVSCNYGVVGYHVRLTRERSPVRARVVAFLWKTGIKIKSVWPLCGCSAPCLSLPGTSASPPPAISTVGGSPCG